MGGNAGDAASGRLCLVRVCTKRLMSKKGESGFVYIILFWYDEAEHGFGEFL